MWREQAIIVIAAHDLYCCLLPQCQALRTCRSGFPIATQSHLTRIFRLYTALKLAKEHRICFTLGGDKELTKTKCSWKTKDILQCNQKTGEIELWVCVWETVRVKGGRDSGIFAKHAQAPDVMCNTSLQDLKNSMKLQEVAFVKRGNVVVPALTHSSAASQLIACLHNTVNALQMLFDTLPWTRGGRSHFFRLRLRSCFKFLLLDPSPARRIFQIW